MGLKTKVLDKLRTIDEPELCRDVVSLGLIHDLRLNQEERSLSLSFRPKNYHCSIGIQLSLIVKMALIEIEELKEIEVKVTDYSRAVEANRYLRTLDRNLIRRM